MGRYIDADKVVDVMKVAYWDENMQSAKDDPCVIDAMIDWAIRQVKDAPTEDVAPVIHAHWITTKLSTKWTFRCSNCNSFSYESTEGSDIQWKYCPDCRATMDEEVE